MGKPKLNVIKENKKIIHPKSRKAKQLSKKVSRDLKLQKRKGESNVKLQFLGDKLAWFKENMDQQLEEFTPKDVLELIQKYIDRNLVENEQIQLKHNIGGRTSRQHASREDHIRITREREMSQFTSSGFETVDFLNPKALEIFKSWTGELRYLSNLKLQKFTKQFLESGVSVAPEECTSLHVPESEDEEEMDEETYDTNIVSENVEEIK
ncbi:translation machinery-associated protein 16 isoform X2 [Procambarus clarkii]|uniref:translation machinery-associated protein 16 isoform X2 n=1 Tax=Procambarus clarkii TaxID=6728 RepID=UPI001E675241|nr:translation machinery-associated protein 16-like isoform X2 [Procambarus clarkii]